MSLYDDLKKEKIISEDKDGNVIINRTDEERARIEQKKIHNNQIAPIKNVVSRFSNMGQSASTGIKRGLLNRITNVTNRSKYVGKNLGAGTLQGIAGIGQSALTESANEMRKGQEKDVNGIINQIGKAIVNNRANNIVDDTIRITKSDLETIKNKDKNLWEKLVGITTNHISESAKAVTPGYSIFSALNQVAGKITPQASNIALDVNQKISAPIKDLQQKVAEEGQNYDGVTRFLGEGANVVGNMAPSIVTSAITKNPEMALGVMGLSAKGQSTNEAMDKGADLDEAVKIGDTKALVEIGTEKMTGGAKLFGGGTTAEEALRNQIKNKVGNRVLQSIANAGLDIAGEGLEETVSDIVDTAIDKGTTDRDASYSLKDWGKTQGITALTTLALNGLGIGGNAISQKIQDIANRPTAPIQQTQNQPTAPVNTLNQQQNQTVQNRNMEQIKIDSENFSRQIDDVKNGTFPQKDMLTLGKTPQALIDIGLPDLPITMTQRHLDTIMNESGKYKNANYHGLGEEIVKQLPEAINNPLDIVKSNTKDDSVVLTTYLADKQGRPVIASIKIDGTGRVNDIMIDTNVMTSAYGRNNYDKFMQDNIKNENLLYDIDRGVIKKVTGARLQLPRTSNFSTNDGSFINNSIPPINQKVNGNTINNNYAQNTQNDTQNQPIPPINNTQGETINWNEIERPEGKIRKHYKSIIESSNTTAEAKKIARELMGSDTYVPESNKQHLNEADRRIQTNGADNELNALTSMSNRIDAKITANDIAVGERLIEYYSKIGDKAKLQEAIQTTAMAGTQAGRTVQALSLLNHQTPQGQVTWIQRSVDKMNQELVKKRGQNAQQFNFTPEMQQKIMETTNQEEMNQVLDEVYEELGQQVSKSRLEQIDSWRYFSMLANPKTHIRNIVGNVAMGKLQTVKNKVAGTIEGTVAQFNPNMERMHTLKPASKEVKSFARNDITNVADRLELNDNKYNPKSRLENNMRTFKSDVMENTLGKTFELNEKALEVEDAWGLKSGYVKALSEYMTANNLNPQTITDAQLAKARNYAIAEAKEATFHSENAIATAINQFSRKNKVTKGITDAVLPFVKTPMNVAKGGMEYNPAGLIKTLTYDTVQLRKGNISVNKYIDNLSKGLTGTGVAVLGYAMAEAGILKASGGDDEKKEKFDEALGKQSYSLEINGKTYSLDWLAPAGIPLFVGAEAHNINKAGDNEKTSKSTDDDKRSKQIIESMENWANAMTNSMSPMAEMSMISGLTSALKSYDQDSQKMLGTIGTNAVKSYVNQFVPTALGQVAKTTDDYERSTTSTAKGILPKAIDQTKLQMMSKIPGLRQQLPIKTDVWGKEQKQEGNVVEKAVKNAILPFNIKSVSNSKVDKALNELYGKTGSVSILPTTSLDKTFKIDGQTYRMTNEEYNKYRKDYGQNSYKILDSLVSSKSYKDLNNEQKQKAIESIYSYTKEKNKVDYAKNNKLKVEPSTLYNTMEDLKKNGGNQSSYLQYIAKTTGIEKESERNKVLSEADYSSKTKSIIYSNGTGKDDDFYNLVANNTDLNITEYLNYKAQKNAKAFEADKDGDGKAISGTAKKKVYEWVNSNITGYENRLLILGHLYKLSNKERNDLTNYINKKSQNDEEAIESFKNLTKNYTYKNGKIYYK